MDTSHGPAIARTVPVPASDAPLLEWAHYYGSIGWRIFPCRGKVPLANDWPHVATDDPFQIETWWKTLFPGANIGCLCGINWWALDVDPRAGGDQTLLALQKQYGSLPDTLLSLTGGWGQHLLWLLPYGRRVVNKAPLGDGIDVQGHGSYIVLPPSIHPDTKRTYLWDVSYGPDSLMPQEAPEWLLNRVTTGGTTPAWGAPDDSPQPVLEPVDQRIPEGKRDDTLKDYGIHIAHGGMGEPTILEALRDINTRLCDPPLDDAQVRKIAHSTARYRLPRLKVSSNGHRQEQEHAGFDFDKGMPSKRLMTMMMVPPRFLVDKLVPDGLTILSAPSKSYKSYFSLSLALATVGAGKWCDTFEVNEPGNVVFFGLEAPLMQIRNRLHQLNSAYNPNTLLHEITFFTGMKSLPSFREGLHESIEQVIEHYKPRLIVIDPLSYLYRFKRTDDLAGATLDVLLPLAEMVSQAGVALFAPEHMRKRSKEDMSVMDQLNGSYVKSGIVHALLSLQRSGDDLIIGTTMRDAQEQEFTLSIEFDDDGRHIEWSYKGSSEMLAADRRDSLKGKVLEELKNHKYPHKSSDIIDALELPHTDRVKSAVRAILSKAERVGDVATSRRGEYYWVGQ